MQLGSSLAGGGEGSTDRLLLPAPPCDCILLCVFAICCTLINSSSSSSSCFASMRRVGLVVAHASSLQHSDDDEWERGTGEEGDSIESLWRGAWDASRVCERLKSIRGGEERPCVAHCAEAR